MAKPVLVNMLIEKQPWPSVRKAHKDTVIVDYNIGMACMAGKRYRDVHAAFQQALSLDRGGTVGR